MVYKSYRRSLFLYFNYLVSVTTGEHPSFPWNWNFESLVHHPFWPVFGTFGTSICNFWNYFVWPRITDDGSVPEMRILSILILRSDLKWFIDLRRSLFFIFQLFCEYNYWWASESRRAHVAKFYGLLRLICSVLIASKFPVLKLI